MVIPFRIENIKSFLVYNEPNQYKPEKKKVFSRKHGNTKKIKL